MPATTIAMAVGASLKTSPSQPCSGKMGTLTAKAARNESEISHIAAGEKSEWILGELRLQLEVVEGAGACVEREDADEKKRGGNEGIEEELDGGARAVAAAWIAAEHRDQDGHGHKRELPEGVVDHQVERKKDADHRGLLQKQEGVELLHAGVDRAPGGKHADGREEAGEDDQPHGEAVDAEVIANRRGDDPEPVDLELEAGVVVVEVCGQVQREHKSGERDE